MNALIKRLTTAFLLSTLFALISCQTVPEDTSRMPFETPGEEKTADQVSQAIMDTVSVLRSSDGETRRDIDDRDWLMDEINRRADTDQLLVSLIYDALRYRGWDDVTRRTFLTFFIGESMADDGKGALNSLRIENRRELDYLLNQSLLLKDSPWMVRDFFDERSEFSYWYLLYLTRSFEPAWQDDTVLTVMRSLIREDRITAASYIWLNRPETLGTMESEIIKAGYPWNRILHLLKMGRYIRSEVQRLFPGDSPDKRPVDMLF